MKYKTKFDANGKVRTPAYVGTYQTGCAGDMLEVDKIKSVVKQLNEELACSGIVDRHGRPVRFRTTMKGRKPINKVLNKRTGKLRGFTWGGDVIGGLANSAAVDVYIQRRYVW